ncbi:2-amino-4-hydroxy-6-hydroxymethyldihydropteridine diphosphokinase [Candidatus Acetothermia bacterium]|nr:MAG: 2-amino-4-hydroxy-6-hydroxymethyldihydropteridine diphosphokinase [Candidatus Acetothermia bacterium]
MGACMARVFLGLQAEVPPQRERIVAAIEGLQSCGIRIIRASSWFRSAPTENSYGAIGLAVEADTTLDPRQLRSICQGIERILGRELGEELGPAPIEIEILFYNEEIVSDGDLHIPYPHLLRRGVMLASLAELVPGMVHPVLGRTIGELFAELPPERRPRRSGETTSS